MQLGRSSHPRRREMPHSQSEPHIRPKLPCSPHCSSTGVLLLRTAASPKSWLSSCLLPHARLPACILTVPFQASGKQPLPPMSPHSKKYNDACWENYAVSLAFPSEYKLLFQDLNPDLQGLACKKIPAHSADASHT